MLTQSISDLDERLRNALELAEKLTAPQTVRVLSELVDVTQEGLT